MAVGVDISGAVHHMAKVVARSIAIPGVEQGSIGSRVDTSHAAERARGGIVGCSADDVSKAIGVPLAKLAALVMAGNTLEQLGFTSEVPVRHYAVKEAVLPFDRFENVDVLLGPEMKSTGEVMGIDFDFGRAYLKSQLGASQNLPKGGNVFISVRDKDKKGIIPVAKRLKELGFKILTTQGTGKVLKKEGIDVKILPKLAEGRPNIIDYMKNKEVHLIINTPSGRIPRKDEIVIRSTATFYRVPCITTVSGAIASTKAIELLLSHNIEVKSIQDYHHLLSSS